MKKQPTALRFDNVRCAERPRLSLQLMHSATPTAGRRTPRRSHRAGLRTVAMVEVLKGILAMIGAYVFITLIRRDVDFEEAAEHVLFFFHISLNHKLSQQFLNAADKMSDASIAMVAGIAILYATLRFVEGYGLWRQRVWAEWLAIISGCAYLPFEVYKLVRHPNEFHWIILGINILVVLYIGWVRWEEIRADRRLGAEPASTG
jgi:uncharacterized membrane protein (DUF2068 family)